MIPNLPALDNDLDPRWREQQMRKHEIGQWITMILFMLFLVAGLIGGSWFEMQYIGDRGWGLFLATALGATLAGLVFAGLYEIWYRITDARLKAEIRQIDANIQTSLRYGRRFFIGASRQKTADPIRMVADALRRGGR